MTAPKAKTLQARFGFSDPELTTPKHDQIMLWLDANIDQVLKDVSGVTNSTDWKWNAKNITTVYSEDQRSYYNRNLYESLKDRPDQLDKVKSLAEQCRKETLPDFFYPKCKSKIWEYAIVNQNRGSSYSIGFADMKVDFSQPYIVAYTNNNEIKKLQLETDNRTVLFEVKPSIPSLGEVIRQIRMYQTYTAYTGAMWFIVSPDDRFAEQLRDQGIGFVKVPSTL